jgi:uncharacterized protein (TIGR02594 family)
MAASSRRDLFLQVGANIDNLTAAMKAGRSVLNEFGNSAIDTTAEVQKAFADLGGGAVEQSAKQLENSYKRTFDKIRENARSVVDAPTPKAAVAVIDAAAARQAASTAEKQAGSLRLVADAADRAAKATTGDASAARVYAIAAEAAAAGAQEQAMALRTQAEVIGSVDAELRTTLQAQGEHVAAGKQIVEQTGAQKFAMRDLGYQLQDISTQLGTGAPLMQIFAQQGGQLFSAFALLADAGAGTGRAIEQTGEASQDAGTDLQGLGDHVSDVAERAGGGQSKFAKFAEFLSGPWGAALIIGVTVLGPLVAKLFEHNQALDDGVDKLKKDAEQTEVARQAKILFARTEDGVAAAIREQADAQRKATEAEKSAAEQANITAKANLAHEISVRRGTAALLERAKVDAGSFGLGITGGTTVNLSQSEAASQVYALKDELAKNDAAILTAEQTLSQTRIELAEESAKRLADPIERIKKLYDDQAKAARDAARATGDVSIASAHALSLQLAAIDRKKQAAITAEQDAEQKRKHPASLGNAVSTATGAELLASAQQFRGLSETRDNGTLQDLFGKANMHVDPKITAWCAAFVNAVLATNGLPGTGSLSARSFLKYGESTDKPVPGDIVVSKRGTGAEGHVGFFQGTDAKGNILVLGGNTGDKVGTEHIAPRNVLGFRRASDDGKGEQRQQTAEDKARDNAATYANLLTRAQEEQLTLTRARVTDIRTAADLDARTVELQRQQLNAAADKGVGDRKWSAEQATALKLLNESNAAAKLDKIRVTEAQALLQQQVDIEKATLDSKAESLNLDSRLAKTRKDQLAIELRILAMQEEAVKRDAFNVVADPNATPAEKAKALGRINAVDDQHDRNVRYINEQHLDPVASYGDKLKRNVGDIGEAFKSVKADGLQGLEDGLVGIVSGTESVAGAFKKMAASIISDIARIAVEKLILSVVGFKDGIVPGAPGNAAGLVPGFADGIIRGAGTGTSDSIHGWMEGVGAIRVANGESIINANSTRRYRPVLKAINESRFPGFIPAGQIYMRPLPSATSIQRAPTGSNAPIIYDFRGAVTTEGLLRQMNEISAQHAQVAIVTGSQMAQQESADAAMQRIPT